MNIKTFEGGYDKNFCYLIWSENSQETCLVDPSVEIDPIIDYLDRQNLFIDKIFITHTHFDHTRYLNDIISKYPDTEIYAYKNARLDVKLFNGLSHNDEIKVGGYSIKSLHTPGHYMDSMCYWIHKEKVIFTGDTVFVGRTGRTVSKGSSLSDLFSSIYNIILKLPEDTIIYPGHNYGTSKSISIKKNTELSSFFRCKSYNEFSDVMKNFEKNRKK